MSHLVPIAKLSDVPPEVGFHSRVAGRDIALFRIGDKFLAIDNTCPHRGGALAEGSLTGTVVSCPVHGWQFDLKSGACISGGKARLNTYPVVVESDSILVDLGGTPGGAPGSGGQFLVRFGAMGHIGRFRTAGAVNARRGSRVVVQSSRGLELGEVLLAADGDAPLVADQPDSGELVREMTDDDRTRDRMLREGQQLAFDACQQLLMQRGVPVQLVDAEQLFDGQTLIFYFLGDAPPALADVTNELARQYESHIQFRPFDAAACGTECGREGGHGCGACGDGACAGGSG